MAQNPKQPAAAVASDGDGLLLSLAQLAEAPHPDHAFIALCHEHVANIRALNAHDGDDAEHERLGLAYDRTRDAIDAATAPTSFAGVVAKARAVRAEAAQADGSVDVHDFGHRWALEAVDGLLKLCGREVT
jgi:hypothetical protein